MATQTGSIDLKGITSAYSDQQQYFWVESNSSATWGGGAHITNVTESAFKTAAGTWGTDPTAGGYNLLMNTDTISGTGSLQLRNGSLPIMNLDNDSLDFNIMDSTTTPYTTINVAQFGADGARIGDANNAHSVIDDKGQRFYAVDGTTRLANIGYDEGTTSTGGTDIAPYYTFGVRKTTTTAYSSSSTYAVGDMCVYDEKIYICIYDITTPESWTSSHWKYYIGNYSHAEGSYITASGYSSHAEGVRTVASEGYSHAEGGDTIANGFCSHAEGSYTTTSGRYSHAEGELTKASGECSHAEGYDTIARGQYSHAEGLRATASGYCSHAEGSGTISSSYSHAEGAGTTASGHASHAEGATTTASGSYSHAEGYDAQAIGDYSHAQNHYTIATEDYQTVIGKYNAATVTGSGTNINPYVYSDVGDYAFIIGNGIANTTADRSNALIVDWVGNVRAAGDVYVGCNADSTGGTKVLKDLSGMFVMSGEAVSTGSVSAQSNKYDTTPIERSGKWLPIAITGYYSSGTNISGINVYNMYLSDRQYDSTNNKGKANLHWGIRNVLQSGTLNATISFQVLWAKVS